MANYNKIANAIDAFHGRDGELESLSQAYESDRSQLWVVYGRRRIGKTTLLKRFVESKRAFFFSGGKERTHEQIRRFLGELADYTGQPVLKKIRAATWTEAFSMLDQHVSMSPRKTVVILDEFQWMCRGAPGVLSDLQRLWDHGWKDSGRVVLILCGSAVSFMVGEVLAQKSPLFGRRTGSLHLQPMMAQEVGAFFGARGRFEIAEALISLGGVPAYLELFHGGGSVRQTLSDLAFRKDGYLVKEAELVFGEQLREKERYYQIARLLSACPSSMADLSRATGLNKGQLSFYLDRLLMLGFIDKHRPITKLTTSKTVRYRLRDEYLRFYFSFVEPNLDRITLGGSRSGYSFDRMTAGRWETFLGLGFELFVSRNVEAMLRAAGSRDVVNRIGSYWHAGTARRPGVQIDLVIEREDGVTNIVECKWSRRRVGRAVVDELSRKCDLYPNPRQHTLEPVLVAAAGATKGVTEAGVRTVTLKDLYAPE